MQHRPPRRGEVWFVHTPGRPGDPHQPRPSLVVSADARNRVTEHLIIIPIFSTGRLGPTRVAIVAGTGRLPHDSVLFCEEIATIDWDFLEDGPLGPPMPEAVLEEVIRAVRRALGDVVV